MRNTALSVRNTVLGTLTLLPLLVSSHAVAIAVPDKPHLVTQGHSEIKVAPDMATLSVKVTALKSDSRAAKEDVDTKVAALFSRLAGLGVTKKDIDSGNVITRPDYQYSKKEDKPKLLGYRAERNISVRLYDLDQLSQVLNKVLEQGIQEIQQVSYGRRNSDELRQKARLAAMAKATELAKELSQAAGRELGDVYAIEYQAPRISIPPRHYGALNSKVASEETRDASYVQNDIKFSDQVDVVFVLK
ncbi:SIMPL domain-containing protein [Oceanisphaera pacifica]|uniref:SIMPL domain-containing protein n=1 Tax=Oceanisphaera pacifica TaxID=2818389 RepID=A0ABS3NE41_9GAMM|nr:SIMPL domain-containing protein [Oceanisphaera pacifica]MBO1518551.1 SIMPL domain-containing protein [Oceanisphaera pacifica]